VGVVAARIGFQAVDGLLQEESGSLALVSPEGVVFAANVPGWLLRVAGGPAQAALARQAPRSKAAFAVRGPELLGPEAGLDRAVALAIDWQDPAGVWKLVGLPGPNPMSSGLDRALLGGMVFFAGFLGSVAWLERRRQVEEERIHQEDMAAVLMEGKRLAERAAQAKADFLAKMSHEIRTPMNAIIGMSHLALKADPTPRQRETLDRILSASEHLLAILNDVLDYSKLEAGKVEAEHVDFRLASVLGTVRDLVAQKAAAKGLELDFQVDPRVPPELAGDPLRLGQILINYANNAVKFTERGWIRISVDCLEEGPDDVLLRFAVRDTGIGLTEAERGRLFQAFQQAGASITRSHGGTGLGLAICRQLAGLMGGEVGVESAPGQGSTFWFKVRLARGRGPVRAGAPEPPRGPGHGRILLVEDNAINREIAADLLKGAGYRVDEAENGAAALRMVQERGYDLVLMDVHMPVMDGLQATVEIRNLPELGGLPILALTAGVLESDRDHCLAAGMNGHIAKPLHPDALFAELARWIGPAPEAALPGADAPRAAPADLPGLDPAAGLGRMAGRQDLYLDVLAQFASDQGDAPARIRAALAAGDPGTAERLAHTLKGLAGTLGAGPVEAWSADLEAAIRRRETPEALATLVDGLEARVAELLRRLGPWLPAAGERLPPGAVPTSPEDAADRATLLVVDDSRLNLSLMASLLSRQYKVRLAASGEEGLRAALEDPRPDLILLDITMPGIDGYQVMERLKAQPRTRDIPVIFLTARGEPEDEQRGLDLGAVDYITKPVSPPILRSRVANHLKLKGVRDFLQDQNSWLEAEVARRTREVGAIQDVTIQAMASLAETRDSETGGHIRRTQHYVRLLALHLHDHPRFRGFLAGGNLDLIFKSAPLHDIGKVGIPDRILLKPGRLTQEEFEIMKRHTTLGRKAIEAAERQLGCRMEFLAIAKEIAEGHQEKWDGTGYPAGLKGDAIPIAARLMAVADVYDALISRRVYKPALPHRAAVRIMAQGRGTHFDPDVLDAFLAIEGRFREVADQFRDSESDQEELRRKALEGLG
jgi:response regulator RpfG family c-di-GMP phosphodiesterase/signal transduction histidine kinase